MARVLTESNQVGGIQLEGRVNVNGDNMMHLEAD